MILNARELRQGEILPPWWYGLAYRRDYEYVALFYPIPFNYAVRYWHNFRCWWNWLRAHQPAYRWVREAAYRQELEKERYRGREDGIERGMQIAMIILQEKNGTRGV